MFSKPTDLTLDILPIVFDHLPLSNCARTLSACSLVCKTWLPVARKYLFADLHVGLAQPEDRVMLAEHDSGLVEWNGLVKPKHADPFLAQQLRITARGEHPLTQHILSRTLLACPRVKHLRIDGARIPASSMSVIPVVSHAVETIHLYNVHVLPQELIGFLSFFPGTRAITMDDCDILCLEANEAKPVSSPSALSRIQPTSLKVVYFDANSSGLFDFFGRTRMVNTLRKFTFSLLYGASLNEDLGTDLSDFIGQLKNLESLAWDDAPWDTGMAMFLAKYQPEHEAEIAAMELKIRTFQTQIASILPKLSNLRTFSMNPVSPNLPERVCAAFLESLPISIHHIEIHISSYASWRFELFAKALARFPHLQSFAIVMLEKEFADYDARVEELKVTLCDLSSQGKLEIVAKQN